VRRHSSGLYLSFESDRHPDRIADAFPPATLARLRRLKTTLDPHNLFQDNFNITPTHDDTRNVS
jgi:FAD/FMN-containing dehydrogenase